MVEHQSSQIKNLPKGATVIDYDYMIHTDIRNSMMAAKVNGNIVFPLHVLANDEVVEIVTYNAFSSKSAFQRHKQWLQHAKIHSATHKIMKFLKEQAAQSASQLTLDSVNKFLADSGDDREVEEVADYSKGTRHTWEKILMNTYCMLANITKALADVGVTICSCAAEVVRRRGMAVILVHVEASLDNMVFVINSKCCLISTHLEIVCWP